MSDCMTFPDTVEEFMEQYKVVDTDHVYSNGTEFVPIFRMKQWFEHRVDRMKFVQQAVNTIISTSRSYSIRDRAFRNSARLIQNAIDGKAPDFEQIPEGDEMPAERKQGKWEDIGGIIRWGCPICHHAYETKSNFCPNCGAKMEEPEDMPMEYFESGGR